MIRGFEQIHYMEPESEGHFQWSAAIGAGLIAGVILLLVPHGSPWSSLSFFSAVIMGRQVPPGISMPLPLVCVAHLALAEIYGLIISRFLVNATQARAVFTGAILGLVLYMVNFSVVSTLWQSWRGNEVAVLFTHGVFGLIVGGAYRGLLKRKSAAVTPG